jgi:hypothetical protein
VSARGIRGRLDKLAGHIAVTEAAQEECRLHGTACEMGKVWPLRTLAQDLELQQMIREAQIGAGVPVSMPEYPDPLTTDIHEAMTAEEKEAKRQELETLIAEARAKAVREEAAIIDGGDPA